MELFVDTAMAMEDLGRRLGENCPALSCIYLQGDLGAGKTTLVRGFLRGNGYAGKVKSPTYTLVEPYELENVSIFHFDLYRLENSEELENIGFRDYFDGQGSCLVEWPEKAQSKLPSPDLSIIINIETEGRRLQIQALSPAGEELLLKIQ
jgi:tRNA threonylcarbamoyladenosine biosynthesis protein TsaE